MKKILSTALLLAAVLTASAQEKQKYYVPQKRDWSVGITYNPATMVRDIRVQPKPGDFAGAWIEELAASPKQMFILSQDPIAAVRAKYFISSKAAVRATLGFNGSLINYKEYVRDDLAAAADPDTENKVVDNLRSNLNSLSLQLGYEGRLGEGCVRFVYGFDLMYSIAGGTMTFQYGNELTDLNHVPSTMPMTSEMKAGSVNDFQSKLGIDYLGVLFNSCRDNMVQLITIFFFRKDSVPSSFNEITYSSTYNRRYNNIHVKLFVSFLLFNTRSGCSNSSTSISTIVQGLWVA